MQRYEKQKQRTLMMANRAKVSDDERNHAAKAVVPLVTRTLEAQSVGLYYPVRGEFDCLPLLAALAALGVETSLPVVTDRHDKLTFRPWKPGEELAKGEYDIPAPLNKGLSISPDMLIVPLLGFDANGARLGYGGGYYDRTLEFLRARNEGFEAMGIAYDFQKLKDLAIEDHDQQLDMVVTPSGFNEF